MDNGFSKNNLKIREEKATKIEKNQIDVKKNAFESVLMRWKKLEPIIQSEVSQKEKDQYSTLKHIFRI